MISLGVLLIIFAGFLFGYAKCLDFSIRTEKESLGIPKGIILYSDLNESAKPLFSKRSRLIGKPDYVVRRENYYIPVEVKSGGSLHPHQSQILQLAAYCLILEDTFGLFVPEGILVYNNIKYTIPFDPKLRFELESIMKTMRASLRNGVIQRNHEDISRCRYCSMKKHCINEVSEIY